MDNDLRITETIVYLYTYSSDNHLVVSAELQYSGKIEIQKWPALFRNPQNFVDCSMGRSKGIIFLIDLESIQHKLSSDYSLNIYFSRRFPYNDGPSFSPYKPLQNVDFSKVGNMQFSFRNCTHILTRTQGKKFGDMLLDKLASKGTSLCLFDCRVIRQYTKYIMYGHNIYY